MTVAEEAVLYRKYLLEQLDAFDTFVQTRLEEPKPPMVSADCRLNRDISCSDLRARSYLAPGINAAGSKPLKRSGVIWLAMATRKISWANAMYTPPVVVRKHLRYRLVGECRGKQLGAVGQLAPQAAPDVRGGDGIGIEIQQHAV